MFIKEIKVKNFRLLKSCSLTLDKESTVIVGRNNSGKTSLAEIFRRLSSGKTPEFKLEDFNVSSLEGFKEALKAKIEGEKDEDVRLKIPEINLTIIIDYEDDKNDYGNLGDFIIDLDEESTEVIIDINYAVQDGKIEALFFGLEIGDTNIFDVLKDRIPKYFTSTISSIDPTDINNALVIDYSKLLRLLGFDFINAQRGLDDVTQSEKDVLGKVLSNIFKTASEVTASEEMKKKSSDLMAVVDDLQNKIDSDFKEKVDALLPALDIFGYPGLSDPKFTTQTSFDTQTILESNTKLRYQKADGISLPETYNGLGSRNLIFILFQLFDFFRKYQTNPNKIKSHTIFIEEPEAHLHPQMQEVFIKKLYEIVKEFSSKMNGGELWPVQFIVSTHSTHIANEASFEAIRYFLTKNLKAPETYVKDLNYEFNNGKVKADKEFIHKYLTLTKCDLFFADKVILIEGTSERILMPKFIEKFDEITTSRKLGSQYISTVEIGGAYAHLFYKFLDFLELKTLVITDIDSVNGVKYSSCCVSEGTHTSNAGIRGWFKKLDDEVIDLKEIRSKSDDDKLEGNRRLAFQIPEKGKTSCGRSFEDAFIIANPTLFGTKETEEKKIEIEAYNVAETFKNKKTDFALRFALDDTTWNIPLYLHEGLLWLAEDVIDIEIEEEKEEEKEVDGE